MDTVAILITTDTGRQLNYLIVSYCIYSDPIGKHDRHHLLKLGISLEKRDSAHQQWRERIACFADRL